jgi:hypothetical protein
VKNQIKTDNREFSFPGEGEHKQGTWTYNRTKIEFSTLFSSIVRQPYGPHSFDATEMGNSPPLLPCHARATDHVWQGRAGHAVLDSLGCVPFAVSSGGAHRHAHCSYDARILDPLWAESPCGRLGL